MFGASRDGMELVGVLLNCPDWFDEAERLMDGCFESYSMVRVLAPAMSAGKIAVEGGKQETAGFAPCRICACRSERAKRRR